MILELDLWKTGQWPSQFLVDLLELSKRRQIGTWTSLNALEIHQQEHQIILSHLNPHRWNRCGSVPLPGWVQLSATTASGRVGKKTSRITFIPLRWIYANIALQICSHARPESILSWFFSRPDSCGILPKKAFEKKGPRETYLPQKALER